MGEHRVTTASGRRFSEALLRDLRALEGLLEAGAFESEPRRIGAEQELFLVDGRGDPALLADEVLARAEDPRLTTELGRFNLEGNLTPLPFTGRCLSRLEADLEGLLAAARAAAAPLGADVVLTGILPTLRHGDVGPEAMTPRARYRLLEERLAHLRAGKPYQLHICGLDEFTLRHDSVMLEACNTSFQVHLQVTQDNFARRYNAAQAAAGPVLAAAANAPLLFGRRLWRETRIALFEQSTDTRPGDLPHRRGGARVFFGHDWVRASILELYQEDVARFPSLFAAAEEEDPLAVMAEGGVPRLRALALHNGTVYRWMRPCYGVTDGRPHLRIENRVLPSGPTLRDEVANAALWLGLMQALPDALGDVAEHMPFDDARHNFAEAARLGIEAPMRWLGQPPLPAHRLLLDTLLPMAHDGLTAAGLAADDVATYLGVVEARAASRRTGAQWLLDGWATLGGAGHGHGRALVQALLRRQRAGAPVHTWAPLDPAEAAADAALPDADAPALRVEEWMSTDLYTVGPDESLERAAAVMAWRAVRHVPVEDAGQRLVGLLTTGGVLRRFIRDGGPAAPVRDAMVADPLTVTPETSLAEAVRLLRRHRVGALPVVSGGRLVGILTERDVLDVAARHLGSPETALETTPEVVAEGEGA